MLLLIWVFCKFFLCFNVLRWELPKTGVYFSGRYFSLSKSGDSKFSVYI